VAVDVEVGDVAVQRRPHRVGELAEVEQVRGGEALQRVGLVEADAVAYLRREVAQLGREGCGFDGAWRHAQRVYPAQP
jgi:hypothetical protein